jgi:hypothetical protein
MPGIFVCTRKLLFEGCKKYTSLDVPNATTTVARGINNSGQIVLQWSDSSGLSQAALYNGKTYKKINVPVAFESIPEGI